MRGFTLLELLIVMGITMLLGASAIGYSRSGEETLNLQISVQKVLSDINQTTSYALSSPERRGHPGERYCGFGIHFDQGNEMYKVFGDVKPTGSGLKCSDSDKRYVQGADDVLYESTLKHSKIDSATSDVLFIPPDPIRYVNGATSTIPVEIILRGRGTQPVSSV